MTHPIPWGIILAALTTAGCALSEPAEDVGRFPPANLPEPESAHAIPEDAKPEHESPVLTLDRCIEIALSRNPDVARSEWAVKTAAADLDIARGERWPTLGVSAGYVHTTPPQRLIQPSSPVDPGIWTENQFAADVVLRMPIYTGGRIVNQIRATDLLRAAQEGRLARTREELTFSVTSVFFAILRQRHVIESAEFSRQALVEHKKRIENMIAVQRAARVDLLRTQVRIADIEQLLVRGRNTLEIQRQVLANLMGRPPALERNLPPVQGALAVDAFEVDYTDAVEQAFDSRNDYKAARAVVEAQARRVAVAQSGRRPTVELVGSYGGRWAAGTTSGLPGADSAESLGHVGALIEVPIFQGGRIDARIRRERYRLAEATETLRKLELTIRLDVDTALRNIRSAREQVTATESAVGQGEESLRIEREKHSLGKGSITDVLDSQSALLGTQAAYYGALAEYQTARAEYRLAVGESR